MSSNEDMGVLFGVGLQRETKGTAIVGSLTHVYNMFAFCVFLPVRRCCV